MAHGGNELVIGGKLTFSKAPRPRAFTTGIRSVDPAENVPASEATTVASLKETVNALLTALKDAGFMAADPESDPDDGDDDGDDTGGGDTQ